MEQRVRSAQAPFSARLRTIHTHTHARTHARMELTLFRIQFFLDPFETPFGATSYCICVQERAQRRYVISRMPRLGS